MNIPEGFIWVVLTVYLESRNQPDIGERAVVKVILNRAMMKNWPLKDVTLARKQFTCWNDGIEDSSNWITEIATFANTAWNCFEALNEWQNGDTLMGATHYYAIKGMVDGKPPWWSPGMEFITEIQGHRFLKEK